MPRRGYHTFCAEVDQTDASIYDQRGHTCITIELPNVFKYTAPIHHFMKQIYGSSYHHKTSEELREIMLNRYESKKRS